ncbi:MAG: hypothetical protein U0R23_00605 [Candidatus Nanopelagicales bacterium]
MLRRMIFAFLSASALLLGLLSGPATADTDRTLAAKPTAVTAGSRIVVTIPGKKPSKAALLVSGKRYPLKRKGKVWRTKNLSAQTLAGLSGAKAKLKIKVGGRNKSFTTTIGGTTTTPPTGPGTGTAPLFATPGVDRIGQAAWDAVRDYFANSTLTDCPAGWPNCAVEIRYGIFADGTQWYCRLTPTAGSDIRSVGNILNILGAEQKADGAWGVSYTLNSYGDVTTYTLRVAANGSASVQYWGPGASTSGPPTSVDTGLLWMRGAKDCSY